MNNDDFDDLEAEGFEDNGDAGTVPLRSKERACRAHSFGTKFLWDLREKYDRHIRTLMTSARNDPFNVAPQQRREAEWALRSGRRGHNPPGPSPEWECAQRPGPTLRKLML